MYTCGLWVLGVPDSTLTMAKTLCLPGTVGQNRGQLTSGLTVRAHNSLNLLELHNLCENKPVGLSYRYNRLFPVLSIPNPSAQVLLQEHFPGRALSGPVPTGPKTPQIQAGS